MTEDDVTTMETAVLATTLDPALRKVWAATVTTEFRAQEQRLMAEWKMWQHVRSDTKMLAVVTELELVRGCLEHLAHVLDADASKGVD